jgi:hypothetical protein
MVFTLNGKNKIRDLLNTDMTVGKLGTGTTAPTESDTTLASVSAVTVASTTNTVADRQVTTSHSLNSLTGNGVTYTEYGTFNASDVMYARFIFPDISKTASVELNTVVTYRVL